MGQHQVRGAAHSGLGTRPPASPGSKGLARASKPKSEGLEAPLCPVARGKKGIGIFCLVEFQGEPREQVEERAESTGQVDPEL